MQKYTNGWSRAALALVVAGAVAVGAAWWGPVTVSSEPTPGKSDTAPAAKFKAVPLPDPKIPGFKFPEDEATIIGWTEKNDQKSIDRHGWGIWTALHMASGETYNGQPLSVFETWVTPDDILTAQVTRIKDPATVPRVPRPIQRLHQFNRVPRGAGVASDGDSTVTGFVKYDPPAADHIMTKGLFQRTTLNGLLAQMKTDVPAFPFTAVSLKCRFRTLVRGSLVGGRYYRLEAWPGPPATPAAFPPAQWKTWVWVDTQEPGDGPGNGAVDTTGAADGSSRTPATTYGLGRFVYYRLTAADALAHNAIRSTTRDTPEGVAVTGDPAVLLGMHVTSREITRWTWQTFWWTADPANPPAPSSKAIAADRPAALTGGTSAAKNYALAIGYDMLTTATPNTGGTDNGVPLYVYNPWLEAGFSPGVMPDSKPWTFDGKTYDNKFGVQTNCMSCHEQANYTNGPVPTAPKYTADRYIDLNGPQFKGTLKVDFLWSIPGNVQ
jgi:hypothetical protein